MFMCCCAKNRKDNDDSTIGGIETRQKNSSKVLLDFVSEETKIGLREIAWTDLMKEVLVL